jgi:hypothetical protein
MSLVPVSLLPGIAYFFVPLMFRPRNRNVRLKKIGLTLRGDQLTLGRNNISLNESFRCVLTWQALAAEADLLGVELVPNVAGGPSARLRFSVPVAEIESLRLPRLDSHEPLLDAKAFHNVFWPAIRRAAEAHGQKIPWATKIVEAA